MEILRIAGKGSKVPFSWKLKERVKMQGKICTFLLINPHGVQTRKEFQEGTAEDGRTFISGMIYPKEHRIEGRYKFAFLVGNGESLEYIEEKFAFRVVFVESSILNDSGGNPAFINI